MGSFPFKELHSHQLCLQPHSRYDRIGLFEVPQRPKPHRHLHLLNQLPDELRDQRFRNVTFTVQADQLLSNRLAEVIRIDVHRTYIVSGFLAAVAAHSDDHLLR